MIIAGYLGAGKTTLLREILPQMLESPRVPHVILNDVANAEVDSALLREVVETVQPISGGCICCDSTASLIGVLEHIPEHPPPMVFLEANGTTDPFPLIEMLTLDPVFAERFGPIYQVTVINESRWQKRLFPWDKRIERAQAATASHLMTNRRETATLKQQLRVKTDLEEINPHALRCTPEDLLREISVLSPDSTARIHPGERIEHGHHHLAVRVMLPAMREETLRSWLKSFPPTVLRIKGLVALLDDPTDDACFFQRTDDEFERPNLIKTRMPEGAESCAVLIGNGLDEARIHRSLETFDYGCGERSGHELPRVPTRGKCAG